jgi:hypothetical protein
MIGRGIELKRRGIGDKGREEEEKMGIEEESIVCIIIV